MNHNTAAFAELAARSLLLLHTPPPGLELTVLDNESLQDVSELRSAAADLGVSFQSTRWPMAEYHDASTHGDVLRDFVLANPSADAYLFVDSDICFIQQDSVRHMVDDLEAGADLWAIQARVLTYSEPSPEDLFRRAVLDRRGQRRRLLLRAGLIDPRSGAEDTEFTHGGPVHERCRSVCALIRNSSAFQWITRHFGLSSYWVWSEDPAIGGFGDTLALPSRVFSAMGMRFAYSRCGVFHFSHVATDEPVNPRFRAACARLLDVTRSAPTVEQFTTVAREEFRSRDGIAEPPASGCTGVEAPSTAAGQGDGAVHDFAVSLREAREACGVDLDAAAARASVSADQWAKLESGRVDPAAVRFETLWRMVSVVAEGREDRIRLLYRTGSAYAAMLDALL